MSGRLEQGRAVQRRIHLGQDLGKVERTGEEPDGRELEAPFIKGTVCLYLFRLSHWVSQCKAK